MSLCWNMPGALRLSFWVMNLLLLEAPRDCRLQGQMVHVRLVPSLCDSKQIIQESSSLKGTKELEESTKQCSRPIKSEYINLPFSNWQ
jgi:hypothetical protein